MITTTPSEAEDAMNARFLAAFTVSAVVSLIGYQPVVLWAGIEKSQKPDTTKYYVRVSHQIVLTGQANLSGCEGLPGQKRYRTSGLTFVQLFAPTSDKQVREKALKLATIARNAFRGNLAQGGEDIVWFRNARINNNLPIENDQYRLNVVAEHEYDELG